MRIAHFTPCDAANRAGPLAARAKRLDASWQVREENEYYVPDPDEDDTFEPDPELLDAADARTREQRDAMALLDDAENLLGVLLAAVEDEGDRRAMQIDTVVRIVRKKLRKAHQCIDRQESGHRDLFLAYFALKSRSGDEPR